MPFNVFMFNLLPYNEVNEQFSNENGNPGFLLSLSLFKMHQKNVLVHALLRDPLFTGPSKLGFHRGPAMVRTSSGVPMTSASVASYRFGTCFVLETLHVVQARLPDQDNRLLVVCIASRPQGALRRPFPSIIEPN